MRRCFHSENREKHHAIRCEQLTSGNAHVWKYLCVFSWNVKIQRIFLCIMLQKRLQQIMVYQHKILPQNKFSSTNLIIASFFW